MNKRIFLSPPWMCGNERLRVDEAFASNYIAPCGPMVERFEREFAAAVGMPHACAVSSGTAALDLLFHELGVARGERVFCSDLTFVSSIASAVHRGAEPVFIDCDASTWTMDPDLLAEALADGAKAGRLPKAVVAVDLYGQCCDYERIEPLCERYGVPLIIDAAEALGAVYGTKNLAAGSAQRCGGRIRHAGDAGWAAVYSFNGNKIITTSGGGMLTSREAGVVARARKRSQQSRESVAWYEHEELGYNYRMSNIVAAIGVGQLESLPRIVEKKRQIFDWYRHALSGAAEVGFMPEASYGRCTRWLTVLEIGTGGLTCGRSDDRTRAASESSDACGGRPSGAVMGVVGALERENIESRPVWKPMHLQPVFQDARVYGGKVSERVFLNGVCLPSGAGLEKEDVERVSERVSVSLQDER